MKKLFQIEVKRNTEVTTGTAVGRFRESPIIREPSIGAITPHVKPPLVFDDAESDDLDEKSGWKIRMKNLDGWQCNIPPRLFKMIGNESHGSGSCYKNTE